MQVLRIFLAILYPEYALCWVFLVLMPCSSLLDARKVAFCSESLPAQR